MTTKNTGEKWIHCTMDAKSSNKPHYIWKTFANKTPETFITAATSAIKLSQLSALFNYSVHNNIFGSISSSLCSSSTLRATNTWRWTSGCPPCWRRTPWGWCWTLQGTKAPGSTSSLSTNSAPLVTVWVWSVCVHTVWEYPTVRQGLIKTGLLQFLIN